MNYLFLFLFSLFSITFNNIICFEQIELSYSSNNFYIPIKISKNEEEDHYIFSNMLAANIFPSSKCDICETHIINEKDNNSYSFIKSGVTIPYYYNNYSGDLYESNVTLGTQKISMKLVAFDTITYAKKYSGKGRFSLSFLNYNFNTEKKMFGISINYDEKAFIDFGGYDQDRIKDKSQLKTFNITKTNYTDELQNMWYIDFSSLSINDKKLENKSYKLTFDINTNNFHIPKDFFFENINYIFHEDSKCQVQSNGYFLCICDSDYQKKFPNFRFFNENNDSFYVNTTDYLSIYDSTSYCYVLLELNYENDLFIAGKYVMNNYYSIFDIDNNQLKFYLNNRSAFIQNDFILLLFLLCMGGLLFLCCCFIYRQFFSRNQDDELNINEDLIQENGEGEEGREDDNENEENNLNDNQNISLQNIEDNDNNDVIRENDDYIVLDENNEIIDNEQKENNIIVDNINSDNN